MTLRSRLNINPFNLVIKLLLVVAFTGCAISSRAFAPEFYASDSRLASGRWAKIAVTDDGIYQLSPQSLRQMGFNDPAKVKVFGYGGRPVELKMTPELQIDDLPQVPLIRKSDGSILFYGLGTLYLDKDGIPVNNTYTTEGYYFITDSCDDLPDREIPSTPASTVTATADAATSFVNTAIHQKELFAAAPTGTVFYGESFVNNRAQSFDLNLPGRIDPNGQVKISYGFVAKSTQPSSVTLSVDGQQVGPTGRIPAVTATHTHYAQVRNSSDINFSGDKITVKVDYSTASTPSMAGLDYITVAYDRRLAVDRSPLLFSLAAKSFKISGASSSTRIIDVTDPLAVTVPASALNGSDLVVNPTATAKSSYALFDLDGNFPSPKYCGSVDNQNIHAHEVPDMVIFTPAEFMTQAQRLADRRRNGPDSLTVLVLDQQDVFNEFSSGAPDPMAFRKCLKMFYDRSAESDRKLRFALMFGRGTYDNRVVTSEAKALGYPKMPLWESSISDNDSDSYTTDDFFAFLEDGSGATPFSDKFSIAVGRLPVTSTSDAKAAIDKIINYEENMTVSNWRNRMLFVAEDGDGGVHLSQTERMWREALVSPRGANTLYDKIYLDFYPRDGNVTTARTYLLRHLQDGTTFFSYIGHANTTSLSHHNLLSYSDINSLHLSRYSIVYAATCEFLRWDDIQISAAEIMWRLSTGGAISVISANRPVFISDNGPLSASFARHCHDSHPDGRPFTIGEIYQATKNDYRRLVGNDGVQTGAIQGNSNKLRFVLLGDPSMYPITAANQVVIDAINGIDPADDNLQVVIQGNQNVTVSGHIADYAGNPLTDFNGIINTTLYDADRSLTTLDLDKSGVKQTFDQHGDRLYEGNDSVVDGIFQISVPMSGEIANNFRNASLNLYARADNGTTAAAVERRFYVYGIDEDAAPDNIPPTIKSFYLNHKSFTDGAVVNPSPMVIAEITDNRVINIGTAGIGHQISLKLDGGTSFTDVSQYYTPYSDGTPGGTIAYPLSNLPDGPHDLRLRVWDGSANSANATINFHVNESTTPVIYDIYTDANPASVEANFYLSYDRPSADVDVTLTIYNLLGRKVWSTTKTGRADSILGFPISWDLTDSAGRRVQRGIYLYQAAVTADGVTSKTVTRKIAVAAQ